MALIVTPTSRRLHRLISYSVQTREALTPPGSDRSPLLFDALLHVWLFDGVMALGGEVQESARFAALGRQSAASRSTPAKGPSRPRWN